MGGEVSQDTHEHIWAGTCTHQASWWNRKARTMRTRVVRPCGQIGRMRVVLGSCSAESTRKGGKGVWVWVEWCSRSIPTTLWHDGRNNSAEVPAGGQYLQKKGGSAGKVVVRVHFKVNALFLVRLGEQTATLVTSHLKCINFEMHSRYRRLRG